MKVQYSLRISLCAVLGTSEPLSCYSKHGDGGDGGDSDDDRDIEALPPHKVLIMCPALWQLNYTHSCKFYA